MKKVWNVPTVAKLNVSETKATKASGSEHVAGNGTQHGPGQIVS